MKFPFKLRKSYRKIGGRFGKNSFITKSGATVKIRRNLAQRYRAHKDSLSRAKADRLSKMPKGRLNRLLYRLHPVRLYHYWFSREGAVMALKITGIGLAVFSVLLIGLFAFFRKDLDAIDNLSRTSLAGSIRYYDRTGQTLLWEDFDAIKRVPVEGDQIAKVMKDATVAIEDQDFYKHSGFDTTAIIRAGINNIFNRKSTQGGSTITQQLVKLTLNWTKERTVARKIKELILAIELERSYSKDEILTKYLNTAPYGGIEYGVETSARTYFDKSAKDLTLDEAAMLASIPKSPSLYSPYSPSFDKPAFIGRQHYILDQMRNQGMITKEQLEAAKQTDTLAKVKPTRKGKYEGMKSPYFVLTAREELIAKYGANTINRGGWKVTTTLDTNLQSIAEDEVQKGLAQVKRQGGDVAAFVSEDVKTGQVVALVGGPDFSNPEYGENNYAHDYRLPPGSSFKPYDYAAAIETTDKFGAGTVLYDVEESLPGYPCPGKCLRDYDKRQPGPMTVRYALAGSRNIPAVKAMLIAGVDKTIETASKLMDDDTRDGIQNRYSCYEDEQLTVEAQCYGSSAIGDGAYLRLDDHVHGFATLSRNGRNIPQTYILKIEDVNNKVLDEWKPVSGEQVIRDETAYIIGDMLQDSKASYFSGKNFHEYKGHKFAIKTGTTNDSKDGLLASYSTHYAAVVWVGYHNRRVEMRGFMENMTRPINIGWMRRAHDNLQPVERERPKGIQVLPAFVVRTHVGAGSVEPGPSTDLYPSWYLRSKKSSGEKRVIDIVSNKLATECTPERAKKEVTEGDPQNFSADTFHGGSAASTEEKDDIHKCGDVLPTVSLSAPATCGNTCSFTATFSQGTHPLDSEQFNGTLNFMIDGQIVQSYRVTSPDSITYNYSGDYSGNHEVKAEIVDSVLYSNSDPRSVNFTEGSGGGGTPTINLTVESLGGTNFKFSWNSVSGASSYELCISVNSGSFSCSVRTSPHTQSVVGVNKKAYIKSNNSIQSTTVSF